MTDEAPKRPLAVLAITLGALWLLAGAGFKLLAGTPNDLPAVIREFPLELGLTYRLAIAAELVIGFTALLRPKLAWLPLAAVFVVFDVILVGMLGEDSCGCFGSSVTIPPAAMMAIDSALLLAILVTRPWSMRARRVPFAIVLIVAAIGLALPWLLDRQVRPGGAGPGASNGATDGGSVTAVNEQGELEELGPAWIELDIESWVGQKPSDTPLADYCDLDVIITDGLWVLYRDTCEHCAEHLLELAQTEVGERMVTLVRLRQKNDTEANRVVTLMPEGGFVQKLELPETVDYVLTTPGELVVENDVIVSATEGAGSQD